ncbi:MAG: rod shape-determining protein RodA [Flavobacteriales bacterium]|nr:rod shape-determining protein RodA [Flavobacteriales bacterium]
MNSVKNFDIISCLLVLFLMLIGLVNIYSSTYFIDMSFFSLDNFFGKQLFFCIICICTFFLCIIPDIKIYFKFGSIAYVTMIFILIAVLFFGNEVNGSRSWFSVAGFSFQPSEFMKPITALALAKFLSNINSNIKKFSTQFYCFIIILIPIFLIVIQPDPGTALIFLGFFLVLHVIGLPSIYLNIFIASIMIFMLTIFFGKTNMLIFSISLFGLFFTYKFYKGLKNKKLIYYILSTIIFILCVDFIFNSIFEQRHRDRFNIVLGLDDDLKGIGYNTNQSQLAFKSGGFFGEGFLKGSQTKGDFIPEQHSDYIFATIGEEWGFVGSLITILIFSLLLLRIIERTSVQRNIFYKIYCYCVIVLIFFHFAINISMVIGIFPSVGIPLPFISYGGSSMLAFTILFAGYIKIDSNKKEKW